MGETAISSDIAIHYRRHSKNLSSQISSDAMSIDNITKQYIIDCNLAKANNFLSDKDSQKLFKWIKINIKKRKKLMV